MANVVCPKCNSESYFSLNTYKGPFRCAKCKEVFQISIDNGNVTVANSITTADAEKLNIKTFYKG